MLVSAAPLLAVVAGVRPAPASAAAPDRPLDNPTNPMVNGAMLFDEVWDTVALNFFDPSLNGVDADAIRAEFAPRLTTSMPRTEAAAVINDSLARLRTSHTQLYIPEQIEHPEIRDVFSAMRPDRDPPVRYEGIGFRTRTIDGRTFIEDVYHGGPAHAAGLLRGDELLAVNGEPYEGLASFFELAGIEVFISLRREAGAEPIDIPVSVAWIQPKELFERSIRESARIIEAGGSRVLYVRVTSYAHRDFHAAVKGILRGHDWSDDPPDALVLDIRGGWGGASPDYLDIFNPIIPEMSGHGRDGVERTTRWSWSKPVVMLIDEGSRSGKEILAFAFRKHGIGKLVGTRTAGAVVAGSPTGLRDGSVLYLAVQDVYADGVRIEGVGVEPDVVVERPLAYSKGADPQLERAVDVAREMVEAERAAAAPTEHR